MATLLETFNGANMLTPAQRPEDARQDAVAFGPNLTILKGTAVAIKASDKKAYPLNANATGGANEVQTVAITGTLSAGTWSISLGGVETGPIAYNGNTAAIQSALDAAFGSSQIVAGGTAETATTLTFSGSKFAGQPQSTVAVDITGVTGATGVTVTRTTPGGVTDGTGLFVGFSMHDLATDANGKVYFGSSVTAAAGYRLAPWSTAPIWVKGIFDPQDLQTRTTPTQEVDTFTPANPTTGDVYKLTITNPDASTYTVSATVGSTQTAAAISALLIAAWNADATAAAYATASGTSTVVLTSAVAGNIMNVAGSVTGTGTISKVVTTAANGRAIADILPGCPGARVLHNGFWELP